jgi:peptide deformylase
VCVIDLGERENGTSQPLLIANPELEWVSSTMQKTEEGCLSVPGHYATVVRPLEVRLSYLDENNKKQRLEASGLLADCIQHEIDHLNGILFIEHLSFLKKKFILNKIAKEKKYNKGVL